MENEVKYNLLIVDDEKSSLSVLIHILRRDYSISTARDGQGGIDIALASVPDLILLDIVLPDMDGYAVLSALRESDKTRHIPVVFITGLGSSEDVEKGLAMGAADYITKPFSAAIVTEKVRQHLPQK